MFQFWLLFAIGNRKCAIVEWISTFWIRIGTTIPTFYAHNCTRKRERGKKIKLRNKVLRRCHGKRNCLLIYSNNRNHTWDGNKHHSNLKTLRVCYYLASVFTRPSNWIIQFDMWKCQQVHTLAKLKYIVSLAGLRPSRHTHKHFVFGSNFPIDFSYHFVHKTPLKQRTQQSGRHDSYSYSEIN